MLKENSQVKSANMMTYPHQMRPVMPNSRDVMETCIIKNLISSYYHVVKKNINDLVPKTIMCFLVNQSKMIAEKEMVSQLYKCNELESLLQEDPYIGKKRKLLKDSLSYLKSSMEVLTNFNELSLD
jgi:dynamin 1-like protein